MIYHGASWICRELCYHESFGVLCFYYLCWIYNASYIGAKFPLVKILSVLNDFFSILFCISRIGWTLILVLLRVLILLLFHLSNLLKLLLILKAILLHDLVIGMYRELFLLFESIIV